MNRSGPRPKRRRSSQLYSQLLSASLCLGAACFASAVDSQPPSNEVRAPRGLKVQDFYLPDRSYFNAQPAAQNPAQGEPLKLPQGLTVKSAPLPEPPPLADSFPDQVPLDAPLPPFAPRLVEFQPLLANLIRVSDQLESLGYSLNLPYGKEALPNAAHLQQQVDKQVTFILTLDEAGKLMIERGAGSAQLQQRGYVPLVYKIVNPAGLKGKLAVTSPHNGPVYGGGAVNSLTRQDQLALRSLPEDQVHPERTCEVEMFRVRGSPESPSGLEVEYALLMVNPHGPAGLFDVPLQFAYAADAAAKPTTTDFKLLCDVKPAVRVKLTILDDNGSPTTARFTIRDNQNRIHPPQFKRLAPDFFFQQQIYRADGESILLPPGRYSVEYSRGPEYKLDSKLMDVRDLAEEYQTFRLRRWIDPQARGFYSGDHHIHGAGCSHYTAPTEGVSPADMLRQVKGEGLNVGAVLTWGPCYDFQRRYFSAEADAVSEPLTLIKYDVEVSGFGSQRLGHVCLLNLRDQNYPGSDGTATKGWPTWTVPVMQWAKQQGGVAGYAHSASGMQINPQAQTWRLVEQFDKDGDLMLDRTETAKALLPELFTVVDADGNGRINLIELEASHKRAAETLPNFAIPELNGPGALEICVAAAHGACDFISSMDTARIQEWTIWYHLLNCGLPIAVSGETDFPCMSGTRVGQGRVYVQLGKDLKQLKYADWCRGLAEGRSYVSDGYAHAFDFTVDGKGYGETVELKAPGKVKVRFEVAFGSQTPPGVKHGIVPVAGRGRVGAPGVLDPDTEQKPQLPERYVEVIVNGRSVAVSLVQANNRPHPLVFDVPIEESGWIAVRQFPQLHTNVIRVNVAGRPNRATQRSAEWCTAVIEQLWKNRAAAISEAERPAAEKAYEEAKQFYRRLAAASRAARLQ